MASGKAGMSSGRLRRLWLRLHRWLALALGLPLAIVALLGTLLLVLKPVDRWLHAELFVVAPGPAAPELLEQVRQRLVQEFGPGAALTFRPPREAGESLRVVVRGPWEGAVYLDPRDARELGRRGEHEGAFKLLFEVHSSLLMNEAGKPLLAVLALAYLVLLIGGLVLWWPRRWRQAFALALDRGSLRALFDLHRSGGALLGLLIAVPVLSGAYMAWRPISATVSSMAGQPTLAPPKVPKLTGPVVTPGLDRMVETARQRFAGAPVGYVQLPAAGTGKPIRVRLLLADDPHPNGLSSVWLHPRSGEVLAAHRWNELDPGARAYSWIYPLHTGDLGGLAQQLLNGLLGLVLAGLCGSGLWLWWKRRR